MSVREATLDDVSALERFLYKHTATTMFMRGNLHRYGIGNREQDFAMRYFIEEREGCIIGVGAVGNIGSLMVQAPEGVYNIASFIKSVIPSDTSYDVMSGDSDQVSEFRAAMELNDLPTQMDDVEPLFSLKLDKLVIPAANNAIVRQPNELDAQLLTK